MTGAIVAVIDASALVKLALPEEHSDALRRSRSVSGCEVSVGRGAVGRGIR